jgi:hypothetical protein
METFKIKVKHIFFASCIALVIFSCNSITIPTEFKTACDKYNVYYGKTAGLYVFRFKNNSYGYGVWENGDTYYLKADLYGTRGEGYPSIDAAVTASEIRNRAEDFSWIDEAKEKGKFEVICELK